MRVGEPQPLVWPSRHRGLVVGRHLERTADERAIKASAIADDAAHELVAIEVEQAIPGKGLRRRLGAARGIS